tara:strand:- start:167 stop:1354 length:1188 start_codon:yes stop_codon:yes gene_type:complete
MSCIIKFPSQNSKGVISVTNNELKYIKSELDLINEVKKKWILLYHPNYYDYKFKNKKIFDGYLAWSETFKVLDDDKSKILDLSCHNFIPKFFEISNERKIYDFVGLSKLQTSKGNPKNVLEFLNIVKKTMKLKKNLTGVFIISVPGPRPFKTNYIRSYYHSLFSEEEKKSFEFITLDYDMPFSLSVKTLSLFYNKSKVHLNTHPKERHGRAQAYALCSGLPIVGFNNLTYLVKKEFRNEPFYFVSENIEDFPKQLLKAIDYYDHKYQRLDHDHLAKNFRSADSLNELKKKINLKYGLDNENWNFTDDWDIRLAKHHLGYQSKNSYNQKITEFLSRLNNIDKDQFINEDLDDQKFIEKKGYLYKKMRFFNYQLIINFEKLIIKFKNMARSLINIFK